MGWVERGSLLASRRAVTVSGIWILMGRDGLHHDASVDVSMRQCFCYCHSCYYCRFCHCALAATTAAVDPGTALSSSEPSNYLPLSCAVPLRLDTTNLSCAFTCHSGNVKRRPHSSSKSVGKTFRHCPDRQ